MEKEYPLEPKEIKTDKNGIAWRPFYINDTEVYSLNMNCMMGSEELQETEIEKFRKSVSDHIKFEISKEKLIESIQNRKIKLEE